MNIPEDVRAKISARDYFCQEVLKYIVETGVLDKDYGIDERWILIAKLKLCDEISFRRIAAISAFLRLGLISCIVGVLEGCVLVY